jgi:hypothetical protein
MVDKNVARLFRLHYFRGAHWLSSRTPRQSFTRLASMALAGALIGGVASAQYPGQVEKKSKDAATLRAIAVLEWTGDEGKPKTSRLVPVTIFDGQALQDASVYLARPFPLALAGEVEYELEDNGKPIGLYDVKTAGQEQGMWIGHGAWKALPSAKPAEKPKPIVDTGFDENDDKPVLHRKQKSDSGGSSDSKSSGPSADPDRPKLHKAPDAEDTGDNKSAPDPDRPTMHKETTSTAQNSDSTQPVLKKHDVAAADASDGEHESSTDPDRPRLMRGKPTSSGTEVAPTFIGLPQDMQQAVAVSDVKSRSDHPWSYSWANPDDEDKMKVALEDIARKALGLKTSKPPAIRRASAKSRVKATPPPEPPPLMDEKFRVFELAYGSGATMVFSAHTDGPAKDQKYVTLIAQPDLYGSPLVLLKNVTDSSHLDETPRMHLVDAVDALADNRGELLFELRGASQRQFALYRVLRGSAEKIFATGGGEFGVAPGS